MSSIFSIFDIGVRAMYAQNIALQVTGQNIANANNDNYVRQRAEFKESTPFDFNPGQLGSGVTIEQIIRVKDDFTDYQLQKENQTAGYLEEKENILEQLENIFNEPSESGLNTIIGDFYDSLNNLASSPEQFSTRVMVREKALTLCDAFNNTVSKIKDLKTNLDENISYKIGEINAISQDIADLNKQISRAEVGGMQNANDLRNQRDELVRKLSKYGDVFVQEGKDSLLHVQLGDTNLVTGINHTKLKSETGEDNTIKILTQSSGRDVVINNGSLKALLDSRDSFLDKYLDDLDMLAKSFIDKFNEVHVGGVGVNLSRSETSQNSALSSDVPLANAGYDYNITGGSFTISVYDSHRVLKSENVITINPFVDSLEDVASRINAIPELNSSVSTDGKLNIVVNNPDDQFSFLSDSTMSKDTSGFLIAVGLNTLFKGNDATSIGLTDNIINDVNKIASGKTTAPGDNSNVIDMIATRDKASVNGAKLEDYFSSMIGDLGAERQVTIKRQETQDLISSTLEERRQAQSGVSFDEEAVNLIRFQRGYQAASKFISIIDGLISSVIELV